MTIRIGDIVPLSIARAHFSELADEVRNGVEKIITKNGAAYVALIDARRLERYHRLECDCARWPSVAQPDAPVNHAVTHTETHHAAGGAPEPSPEPKRHGTR
ncbi:type II toxin-antitoxin system Phd/YefM family antitoxin [Burkholderia sp. TSV86]|uniref:type II toxin-antitoxin system Phd/YefM family antitoxin n=1 Tax=Burkholderia sp. TSV86 TaxID=1385594 RepID=UPI0009E6BB8D